MQPGMLTMQALHSTLDLAALLVLMDETNFTESS